MFVILGTIFLALALAFAVAYLIQLRKADPIRVTMTSSVAQVRELAEAFAQYTSAKVFRELVEVKGRVRCASPLLAPLSEKECVYYGMRVRWEYEEAYGEENPETGREAHRREAEEVLAEDTQWQPFVVQDESGEIAVEPQGCEVIATPTLSRHEEEEGLPEETISCGRFALPAPWKTGTEERKPLRYHFEEEAIAVDHEIYVLAEATNESGELRLQKPARGRFVISVKTEEELLRMSQYSLWALLAGAMVCGGAGLVLLFMAR